MKKPLTFKNGIPLPVVNCAILILFLGYAEVTARCIKAGSPIAKIGEYSDSLDFGDTYVNHGQWPVYIYIDNIGTDTLIISSVQSTSSEFTFGEFTGLAKVGPGDRYDMIVGFTPNAVGLRSTNITISTNDPVNPVLFSYAQGFGLEAPIKDSVFQGSSFVGQPASKVLNIKNATPNDQIYDITLYFESENYDGTFFDYGTQLSVPAGDSVALIIPIPTSNIPSGEYFGMLYLTDWYGVRANIGSYWRILQPPAPSNTTYEKTIMVGQTARDFSWLTFINPNDVALDFSVTKKYPSPDFVTLSPQSGTALPHQYSYLGWSFNTNTLPVGTYEQDFILKINDPEFTFDTIHYNLTVIDHGPIISVSDNDITFGRVWVNGWQWPICLSIENHGSDSLILYEVSSTNLDFHIGNVPQGDSIVIPPNTYYEGYYPCISFVPTSVGNISGEIIIRSNDPINPLIRIPVDGIGIPTPVHPISLTDTLFTHQKSIKKITLTNHTNQLADFFVMPAFTDGDFIDNFNAYPSILPGESEDIPIVFNSKDLPPGLYQGEIMIIGDSGNRYFYLPVELYVENTIQDFSLTHFRSNSTVSDFVDTLTLDVADPDIDRYTIRANAVSNEISSVRFTLDGNVVNVDNSEPYIINHWTLPVLSEGWHTLTAQAFTRNNANGDGFEIRQVHIHVINSASITQFDIVDSNGDVIAPLFDGDVINIGQPDMQDINIVARTSINTVRSVRFKLNSNSITARIDNRAPYALNGTSNGHETPWNVNPGSYTITATPYMKYYAWGPSGKSLTVHFTVVDEMPLNANARSGKETLTQKNEGEIQTAVIQNKLTVYPNPIDEDLYVILNDNLVGEFVLTLIDTKGYALYTYQGNTLLNKERLIHINQPDLRSGMYLIVVRMANGSRETTKVIKK